MNQLYVYIYPLFFGFPSHLGHQRALEIYTVKFNLFGILKQAKVTCDRNNQDNSCFCGDRGQVSTRREQEIIWGDEGNALHLDRV